ncbi:hypothetical protein Tco_1205242, partial [Tanacetum coccineum]
LYGSKPEDFRMAIEEVILAENRRLNPVDVVNEECCFTFAFLEVPVAASGSGSSVFST